MCIVPFYWFLPSSPALPTPFSFCSFDSNPLLFPACFIPTLSDNFCHFWLFSFYKGERFGPHPAVFRANSCLCASESLLALLGGPYGSVGIQIGLSCVQDKCLHLCTISLTLSFLFLSYSPCVLILCDISFGDTFYFLLFYYFYIFYI